MFFLFKQKTAYEVRISDWSSDVCSSDLHNVGIIDLAADFRLQDTQVFERWYKMPHACPSVLADSVYGLVELNRQNIDDARVIGNTGCYTTTVLLGLAPWLEGGRKLEIGRERCRARVCKLV